MPLSFTSLLRLKRCNACDQWHASRVFTLLPIDIATSVQTLKGYKDQPGSTEGAALFDAEPFNHFTIVYVAGCRSSLEAVLARGMMEEHVCCLSQHVSTSIIPPLG
jgi:hypothetical protein